MLEAFLRDALSSGTTFEETYTSNDEVRELLNRYERELINNSVGEKSFFVLIANETELGCHEEHMKSTLRPDTKGALEAMDLSQEEIDDKKALYLDKSLIIIPYIHKRLFDFCIGNVYHLLGFFPQTPTRDDILRCHRHAWHVMEKTIEEFVEYRQKLEEIL